MEQLGARFDDHVAGTAIAFPAPERILVAHRPEEVLGVLDAVQRATDDGAWAFGHVAYEAAAGFDPSLAVHPSADDAPPLVWFGITGAPSTPTDLDAAPAHDHQVSWVPGWSPAEHRRRVGVVRDRIAAGETYQANLTVRMRGRFTGDARGLYRDLALAQRGAYNAFLDEGRFVVACAGPELFFEWAGEEVLLRPMKGTAARGRDLERDREAAHALRSSEKERAENVMIVDLMRNDVSRVAVPGSVRVPSLLRVERYPTVLQLTSDVRARLRPGTGLAALFAALFPCGSVTGAPKASTMRLIREVEDHPRGVYCGAVGWVAPPGAPVRARFGVAIRTAVLDRDTGEAVYGTGGGITWGSDAAAEHREVLAKTAVLHRRPRAFTLLETMRHSPVGGLHNRERHLRRLADSAAHLGFAIDRERVEAVLDARLATLPGTVEARVRLSLHRDGTVEVDVGAAPPPGEPCVVAVDREPVDPEQWWLFHKTSMREPYERRRLRRPDVDDVLMVNDRGELTEASRASVLLRFGDRWYTPPLDSGCLPGVERGRRLDEGTLHERVLTLADLAVADELALLSSLRGRRPATVVPARNDEEPVRRAAPAVP